MRGHAAMSLVFCLTLLALSCQAPQQPTIGGLVVLAEEPPQQELEAARAATGDLARSLTAELFKALEAGNPAQAIGICGEVAQRITEAHSTDGLTIRRVSLKVRNRLDEPDDYEREMLAQLQELHDGGALPDESIMVVSDGTGRQLRYLKPIVVMPPCLSCHGTPGEMDQAVLSTLAERYPNDQAIGYSAGDLRGAISVRVEL